MRRAVQGEDCATALSAVSELINDGERSGSCVDARGGSAAKGHRPWQIVMLQNITSFHFPFRKFRQAGTRE